MANQKVLDILTQGVEIWNQWRQQKGNGAWTIPDLNAANLSGVDLSRANLSSTKLQKANLSGATLCGASFHYANLYCANLDSADLRKANLCNVTLHDWSSGSRCSRLYLEKRDAQAQCGGHSSVSWHSCILHGLRKGYGHKT